MIKQKYILRKICAARIFSKQDRNFSQDSPDYIIKSKLPSIDYAKGNVAQFLFKDFQLFQDKVALKCMETKKTVTYARLKDQIARWSGFLTQKGLRQDDTIAIFSPNCLEYASVMLGAAAIGIVTCPMSSTVTSGEVAHMLKFRTPKLVAYAGELEDTLLQGLSIAKQTPMLVSFGQSKKGSILREIFDSKDIPFEDPVELNGEEIFLLPFSSGTSGLPKCVEQSHNAFTINVQQFCNPLGLTIEKASETQQNSWFVCLPMAHIGGTLIQMYGLHKGLRTTIMPKLKSTNALIETIKEDKFTQMFVVPFILNLMGTHPGCSEKEVPHLKVIMSGGSHSPTSTVEILRRKLGPDAKYQEVYGMTESLLTHLTPFNETGNAGTLKLVPDVEAKIVDVETGSSLPRNKIGEICVHTATMMKGYVNNLEATREIIKDGWIRTGDVGYYDEEGCLTIVDRRKDLIKVKSMQVSPSEIEETLVLHPKVRECTVIGVKDEYLGEAPKAFIIKDGNLTEGDIHHYLKSRLAKHKQLAGGIKFVDEFPRTNLGKIKKNLLVKL